MSHFLVSARAALAAVVLTGTALYLSARSLAGARGELGPLVAVIAGLFCVAFMWLLIARLRTLLENPERRALELGLLVLNFVVLVLAFAWVHQELGVMDASKATIQPSHRFLDALYFSVVTITTVGYGDFIPLGIGRAVAAMQALIGYFILGILVSTGFQLIAPSREPQLLADREDGGADADEESADATGADRTGHRAGGGAS